MNRECYLCKIEFEPTSYNQKFCGGKCRQKYYNGPHEWIAPTVSNVRSAIFIRDMFRCFYCGKKSSEAELEIDHIWPESQGGDNRIHNLITSCGPCNTSKGGKIIIPDLIYKIWDEVYRRSYESETFLDSVSIFNKRLEARESRVKQM